MVDVGGARNERKNWIHTFQDVSLIIFVVNVSNFSKKLFEDEVTISLNEDLKLWGDICNNRWFLETKMILLFSGVDQFDEVFENNKQIFD